MRAHGRCHHLKSPRALSLVQVEELSAGHQVLDSACLAPGNLATLGVIIDLDRRLPVQRWELRGDSPVRASGSLRLGSSGTSHLFEEGTTRRGGFFQFEADSELFVQVCALNVPEEIIDAIRLGWTAKKVEETTAPFQYALTTTGCASFTSCKYLVIQTRRPPSSQLMVLGRFI